MQANELKENLSQQLPEYFRKILDFKALMETEQIALDEMAEAVVAVLDNFFIQTCDLATVEAWEHIFGIVASSSDPIEFRRKRILSRLNRQVPYSLPTLKKNLNELLGSGSYELVLDYANYYLQLYVAEDLSDERVLNELRFLLSGMLPAHIRYIVSDAQNSKTNYAYFLTEVIGYNLVDSAIAT